MRSSRGVDPLRNNRPLDVEVWYPAAPSQFGLDLSPSTQDRFEVLPNAPQLRQAAVRDAPIQPGWFLSVLFSHTSLGHRRESTFLCTHLASHGFVVAAADHTGNTFADLVARASADTPRTAQQREELIQRIIADRVPDLQLLAHSITASNNLFSAHIDADHVGLIGWSFGGWAVLAAPEVDARFGAVVALAPGGSSNPLPGIIPARLTFDWKRQVPTLFLVVERDRFTPLDGMFELYDRTPSRKQMLILRRADHDHFGDHIEAPQIPPEHARIFTRGLALAHFESTLKSNAEAADFMHNDPAAALRSRGIDAVEHSR